MPGGSRVLLDQPGGDADGGEGEPPTVPAYGGQVQLGRHVHWRGPLSETCYVPRFGGGTIGRDIGEGLVPILVTVGDAGGGSETAGALRLQVPLGADGGGAGPGARAGGGVVVVVAAFEEVQ